MKWGDDETGVILLNWHYTLNIFQTKTGQLLATDYKNWSISQQLIQQQQQQWWWECYLLQTIFLLVAAIQWLYTIAFIVSSFACFQYVNWDIMGYVGILSFTPKNTPPKVENSKPAKRLIFWDALFNTLAFVLPLFHDFYGKW